MDIVGKAKKLERKIAQSLDAAVVELVGSSAPAPLEIVHAVLDRAEHEIVESGRGQRVFPFNRVIVHVVAGARDKEARARFTAVVEGPPSLAERLHARLRSARCQCPDLTVAVVYGTRAGKQWASRDYHVEFAREPAEPVAPVAPASPARLKLTVVHGKASHRTFAFSGGRVDIGRGAQVLDAKQRLIRTNHVAFDEEGSDANRSVSRRHAHITYDARTCEYRLQDDRSVHGTSIVRNGRTIGIPPGSRGARIEDGDEMLLGQVRIRVGIQT